MNGKHSKFYRAFSLLLTGVADLFYPPHCLLCDQRLEEGIDTICFPCLDAFSLIGKNHEKFSVPGRIDIRKAWAIFDFDEQTQKLIHHLKYSRRRKPVIRVLEHYEKEILKQLDEFTYEWIIPIPLHTLKLRERGYNQVQGISQWLAHRLRTQTGGQLVLRQRYTQTQTQLNAEQRRENVKQAFKVKNKEAIRGMHILLVDDVLTTGATANELASVLMESGAAAVDLFALSTPRLGEA